MAGVDLKAIRIALANQIRNNIARGTNVYPHPVGDAAVPPCVTVVAPEEEYVAPYQTYSTRGPGVITLTLEMRAVGPQPDVHIALDDYLSIGTGASSSVQDAVHTDRTLGGVVDDCVCLTAGGPVEQPDEAWVASLPVQIRVRRT